MWNFKGTLWNSPQNIILIHWKIWFLYNIEILRALRFKSSYVFLKRPPVQLDELRYECSKSIYATMHGNTGDNFRLLCQVCRYYHSTISYMKIKTLIFDNLGKRMRFLSLMCNIHLFSSCKRHPLWFFTEPDFPCIYKVYYISSIYAIVCFDMM